MKIDAYRAYRAPDAIIRVENTEVGRPANLEVISHVHSPVIDENASVNSPTYLRSHLHKKIAGRKKKLREIPIKVEFDKPEHFMRAQFVKWDTAQPDYPICEGNGSVANQVDALTQETRKVKCLGPAKCPIASLGSQCMIDVRINVLANGAPVEIRSNSVNAFSAIYSGLEYAKAQAGGVLSAAQMKLRAWEKSTRGSSYRAFTTLTVDFLGVDAGAHKASEHMNAYGEKLLGLWEQRFHVEQSELDDLRLPEISPTVCKHGDLAINSPQARKDIGALFAGLPLEAKQQA